MYNYRQKKNRGFTMIEMLIAIFIFSISLVSLMSISNRGLQAGGDSQKRIVANYLAIEGIEVIRNMRDSGLLENASSWNDIFDSDCLSGSSCSFEISSNLTLSKCSNCEVNYNKSEYRYRHGSFPGYLPSGFIREIILNVITPGELMVTVNVTWEDGSVQYTKELFLWWAL